MNINFRVFAMFMLLFSALTVMQTQAVEVTDGSLSVDVDNDGEFNVIELNSEVIDDSSFVQEQEGTCAGFSGGSAVNVSGTSATYTATCGAFDVSVVSDVLGPLASNPSVTGLFRQSITYTNNSGSAATLESISDIDQDLADSSGNDVVEFDAGAQAVFAIDSVDGASGTQLMAAIASTDCPGGTFGWDVDFLGDQSTSFPMDNASGPVGPGDTAMTIGFNCGSVASGESVTVTFDYLFSTNLSSVPVGFGTTASAARAIPTLTSWALIALAMLLFAAARGAVLRSAG